MTLRERVAPFSEVARLLLASLSTYLVATGVYDEATLGAILGSCVAIATAFWAGMDIYEENKKKSKEKKDD